MEPLPSFLRTPPTHTFLEALLTMELTAGVPLTGTNAFHRIIHFILTEIRTTKTGSGKQFRVYRWEVSTSAGTSLETANVSLQGIPSKVAPRAKYKEPVNHFTCTTEGGNTHLQTHTPPMIRTFIRCEHLFNLTSDFVHTRIPFIK